MSRRRCGHLFGSSVYLLYDETPIEPRVFASEGLVSILLGQHEQLRLDFLDPDPLDRFVRAAKQAHRMFRGIELCPLCQRAEPWTTS